MSWFGGSSSSPGSWRRIACSSFPQLQARLQPELLHEQRATDAVGVERSSLSAATVEREHLLLPQPLAQRVLGHQRLEFGGEGPVTTQCELGVDPVLDRRETQFLEPLGVDTRVGLELEVGKRPPAPERLCLAQLRRGTVDVTLGEQTSSLAHQLLEALEVEGARLDPKDVARRLGYEERIAGAIGP